VCSLVRLLRCDRCTDAAITTTDEVNLGQQSCSSPADLRRKTCTAALRSRARSEEAVEPTQAHGITARGDAQALAKPLKPRVDR
jgi:hypothetical protein